MTAGESNGRSAPNHAIQQRHNVVPNSEDDDDDAEIGGHALPSQTTLNLWIDVANGIDKNSTVVWKNAVDSLDDANRFFSSSQDARRFVERYMKQVISILLEQQPQKIGQMERNCVEDSLGLSIMILIADLRMKATDKAVGECVILDVLSMVFSRKKIFYKGSKQGWNSSLTGAPEVRTQLIEKFRELRGFELLGFYISSRLASSQFPNLDTLHSILSAAYDAIISQSLNIDLASKKGLEDAVICVARAVMEYMEKSDEESLKKLSHDSLNSLRYDLQRIFDRLSNSRVKEAHSFYSFYRGFALKLITSQSLPLKLYGWDTIADLIDASSDLRPPPKEFLVSGAGCSFVNGRYEFAGQVTEDGFAKPGNDVKYELRVPGIQESDRRCKKLTLFRCTMRSAQKWWFLSEADEDQPGTDKDTDYYQHRSKKHEESEPPRHGWSTCKAGIEPPPTFEASGFMVPPGEEYNTIEHKLARWAIENEIIELVLGDSIHREVVARSTPLIKFLALMCNKDDSTEISPNNETALNTFCLQPNHLKLAWKTCTSKLDTAVSTEVYQLLVSILPCLCNNLATSLLDSIQNSISESDVKQDNIIEVAEFFSTLAASNLHEMDTNSSSGTTKGLPDNVRSEILKLLWKVLTHPNAISLKCYNRLKDFFTFELRVEPMGTSQRESFLKECMKALRGCTMQTYEKRATGHYDEKAALKMVKLTKFLLEACPKDHSIRLVLIDDEALPKVLFEELTTYLKRRESLQSPQQVSRKHSLINVSNTSHSTALMERLDIIRFVYGISSEVNILTDQLDTLWRLCEKPIERQATMVFLADATNSEVSPEEFLTKNDDLTQSQLHQQDVPDPGCDNKHPLTAAFTSEVQEYVFSSLFCSSGVDWKFLGVRAYESFQILFRSLKSQVRTNLTSKGPALDALWRICLLSGENQVASQAMQDLLNVYNSLSMIQEKNNIPNAWNKTSATQEVIANTSESFTQRIFQCLRKVKLALSNNDALSEMSAERCIRILNAAVGHSTGGGDATSSVISSEILNLIKSSTSLKCILRSVPHGLRGQACYRTIRIFAKRTPMQSHTITGASLSQVRDEGHDASMRINSKIPKVQLPSTARFSLKVHPLEPLSCLKWKVSKFCNHQLNLVKPISVNGPGRRPSGNDHSPSNLNVEADSTLISDIGITEGCEVVFLLANNPIPESKPSQIVKKSDRKSGFNLDALFVDDSSSNAFFDTLLAVLEALQIQESFDKPNTHNLVWDLLLSVPTNSNAIKCVHAAAQRPLEDKKGDDLMSIDTLRKDEEWKQILNSSSYQRSVYMMQVTDSFLQPATEVLHNVNKDKYSTLLSSTNLDSASFREGFIESGGFDAFLSFFTNERNESYVKTRTGNAVALRILRCCFFGSSVAEILSGDELQTEEMDTLGLSLMESLKNPEVVMESVVLVVTADTNVSEATILDALCLLRTLLIFRNKADETFASLPNSIAKALVIKLLLWNSKEVLTIATVNNGTRIRRTTEEFILKIPSLLPFALPWLIEALNNIDVTSDSCSEFFSVLICLVKSSKGELETKFSPLNMHLESLATSVCLKLASHPRPSNDATAIGCSTCVLCGCLKLLFAIIQNGGGFALSQGTKQLLKATNVTAWSKSCRSGKGNIMLDLITSPFTSQNEDTVLIDFLGIIFDGFLCYGTSSSSSAVCCDPESRQIGFKVIGAAAAACKGEVGYVSLCLRINNNLATVSPSLQHRWGQNIAMEERGVLTNASTYSGLRNQGCTCYMNSVLQQLFMMPGFQKNICSAKLPSNLRTGGGLIGKGADLTGKQISLQWDNGISYDALVEDYNEKSGMHSVRYLPLQIANCGGSNESYGNNLNQQSLQSNSSDIAELPEEILEEFTLAEGRPGKETGVFEIISREVPGEESDSVLSMISKIEETEEEMSSRRLLEEVQRTFIHLDEGSRGRCFDPRSLVEASGCLKLEFDVWQQNDASEFAMKLLDRLEVPLKRWSPSNFKYLERTFLLKQTKQKICKKCGLKTNREENLMNIDCQIRGKSDIHEALAAMCEEEYMEGDNKVFCDSCKIKCDTVLRTAISALPDMLILSLKRFDLDYNTFETVKLNSMCAFEQNLNMKRYTLEGAEAAENADKSVNNKFTDSKSENDEVDADPLASLPDADYEYRLAGVLVHAGVAQGGHYYSFIKDRTTVNSNDSGKWYRFDDEDVTAFDPSLIETECFGGKVKKETKWPNGQVHVVEQEQFANALMLFYEKVNPAEFESSDDNDSCMEYDESESKKLTEATNGYNVFQADVRQSNATHSWQSFLFDVEFQKFLKDLVDKFASSLLSPAETQKMDISPSLSLFRQDKASPSWQFELLNLFTNFYFDILLHSVEKNVLQNWTNKLIEIFSQFKEGAKYFIHKLAKKTQVASGNWLRIYSAGCPEDSSRSSALLVISMAMKTVLYYEEEIVLLTEWTQTWLKQVRKFEQENLTNARRQGTFPMPTALELDGKHIEDVTMIDSGKASSIGIIISFITYMLEVAPRTWRYNPELCELIRNMAEINSECCGNVVRMALVAAQIPSRLVCLLIREKSPSLLRSYFPGASVSAEIAEAMTRVETSTSPHLLPLANSSNRIDNGGGGNGNNLALPSINENKFILDAIVAVIGIPGTHSAPLIYESGDKVKGSPVIGLSKKAHDAFAIIFKESTTQPAVMGQKEILNYMKLCGVDASNIPTQKIASILTKYSKDGKYLNLNGFLTYYCDTVQSNEAQVRSDLYTFGFKPDLSRRSREVRFFNHGDEEHSYQRSESVTLDVASSTTDDLHLGQLAELGLSSFSLYYAAYCTNEHLGEYILASFSKGRDVDSLIFETLKSLYNSQSGWAGNEVMQACIMILKVLAALPDNKQTQRIESIMLNREKAHIHAEQGSGLFFAAKEYYMTRPSQHYPTEYHHSGLFGRYVDTLKVLQKQREVCKWMSNNSSRWGWIEQWLQSDNTSGLHNQSRGDYLSRRDGSPVHISSGHHHSDSDIQRGINDSDEDDDSRYGTFDSISLISGKVIVKGAGIKAVNGTYTNTSHFDNVSKYSKDGIWKENAEAFSLFRCRLSDNTKRWYISIVPKNIQPGTNKDIDFYLATANGDQNELPHDKKWSTAKEYGIDPPPTVLFKPDATDDPSDSGGHSLTGGENMEYL